MDRKFSMILLVGAILLFTQPSNALSSDTEVLIETEADYILQCQFMEQSDAAYGCINNVFGLPTWVVPRENALAILGLIKASQILGKPLYLERAKLAIDYLMKVQDVDGAWYNQYSYTTPGDPGNPSNREALAKSPTQAAEVMIAFYKLGYNRKRWLAMKKAADYLISCQKNGGDGYLLGGGKDADGNYRSWRYASDNSFGYQALKAAEMWAIINRDYQLAKSCAYAARRIIRGINSTLYISNPNDSDYGVWYRVVDENNQPIDQSHHDWINYAPQMLDLPAYGVNRPQVGRWIHNKLQKEDGSCVWDDGYFRDRKSPGFSFQATLCWRDLRQSQYYRPALDWALDSGLWQITPDDNGAVGGWIDWIEESGNRAQEWERFIDTSFYAITAYSGGYDFRTFPHYLHLRYDKQVLEE